MVALRTCQNCSRKFNIDQHSQVQLSENAGIQTSEERALEGQSPYVYNLQLGYDEPDGLGSASLLYNVFGPRITQVGALGAPDTLEMPVHRIDAIASMRFGDFKVGFKVQDILNFPSVTKSGDQIKDSIIGGRSWSVGLKWSPEN